VQGATLSATGNVIATANVSSGNLNAVSLSLSGNVISGISTTANITGGNLISNGIVSAIGNITGSYFLGNGSALTGIDATSIQNGTSNVRVVSSGGNVSVSVGGTSNVAVFATTGLTITGNLSVGTGTLSGGNIVNTNANGVGNIGATGGFFNTVFAKATSAQYADLAEWYEADADYEPGTVLVFGGDKEVTQAIGINDVRVAGVVSTNPAHIMNSGLKATHTAALALTGRVPTLVVGLIRKGDMMVTAGGGRAQACAEPRMGSVIGKAVQDHPGGQGTIEIVVGRM
jgi:hypothetical protein